MRTALIARNAGCSVVLSWWSLLTMAVFVGLLSASGPALAQPANDLFENRISVGLGTVTGTTVGATAEEGQPFLDGSRNRRMVWWSHTAQQRGQLTIDTCGSAQDTILGVFTGDTLGSLTRVAESRSGCSGVIINTEAGVTYTIAVAHRHGSWPFRLTVGLVPAPSNDLFENRLSIGLGTVTGTTAAATAEEGQPFLDGAMAEFG